MADAGELFVRIRPTGQTQFAEEAQAGITSAGSKLGKLFAGAFVAASAVDLGKSVVQAAVAHQAAFAVLDNTIKNAGAANALYGQSIEKLLEHEARLKGFSDEDLASSFVRLVSVTKDSAKAFHDLGLAEDVARARHLDLAAAALAISKAEQGSATALQRLGIVVPKVTAAVDGLKAKYTEAGGAALKLDAGQKATYASALVVAKAQDAQATRLADLAAIQDRFGGSSATFAKTAAGQFARLQQDFHQFEVTVGTDLLPPLASAAEALGTFFTKASQNAAVRQDLTTFFHDAGVGLHDLKDAAEIVGPPLLDVADHLGGVTHALELLGLTVIGGKLSGALYSTAAAETAVGDAAVVSAGEVTTLEARLATLSKLSAIAIPITIAYEIQKNTGLNQQASDFVHNLGKLLHENIPKGDDLLSTLIGDPGRAGVLGNEIWHLVGAPASAAGTAAGNDFFSAFAGIASTAATSVGQAASNAVVDATLGDIFGPLNAAVAAAGDAAKITAKAKGNDAGAAMLASLADGIKNDRADLAQLKIDMADAVTQGAIAVNQAVQSAKQNFNSIGQSLATGIGAYLTKPLTDAATALGAEGDRLALQYDTVNAKLTASATQLGLEQSRLALEQQVRAEHYVEISAQLDRQDAAATLRAQQRTAKFAAAEALLTQQQNRLGLRSDQQSLANLAREIVLPGGKELSANVTTALAQLNALEKKTHDPALQAFIAQFEGAGIKVRQDKITIATTPNPATAAASAARGVTRDQVGLAGLPTPAEAKRAADLAVAASSNTLAQAGLSARKQVTDTAAQLKRDHLQILQDAAALETQTATTMISNLTDLFDKGKLKFATFSADLEHILAAHHVTLAGITKVEGIAASDLFAAQLLGLGDQAKALQVGPRRAGTGLEPTIVRPLNTLEQSQKQIAAIAKQQRDKTNSLLTEVAKSTKAIAGRTKAASFTSSLDRNPGTKLKLQNDLRGLGR